MNSEKYIGLDVHQATISVAVMDSKGSADDEAGIDPVKALTCQRATPHTAGPAAYRAQVHLLRKFPGN